jgi:uncharacterized membrane protein
MEEVIMAELLVIGFEGKHRAAEVLGQLEDLEQSWTIDLKDAVAAYRTDDGRLRIDRSIQPTSKEGAAGGAILGGLLGALLVAPFTAGTSAAIAASAMGAGAATLGVAGGATGYADARSWKEAAGISEDFVNEVGGMVQPGHSAVFVLVRASHPTNVVEQFRGYGGKVLRSTLPPDATVKLEKMLTPDVA